MIRTQLYLKVEFDHQDSKEAQKIALEIARMVKKIYSVRNVEIQNTIVDEIPDID